MAKKPIKAYLYDNPLTEDPNDFTAHVKSEASLSIEDVSILASQQRHASKFPERGVTNV